MKSVIVSHNQFAFTYYSWGLSETKITHATQISICVAFLFCKRRPEGRREANRERSYVV